MNTDGNEAPTCIHPDITYLPDEYNQVGMVSTFTSIDPHPPHGQRNGVPARTKADTSIPKQGSIMGTREARGREDHERTLFGWAWDADSMKKEAALVGYKVISVPAGSSLEITEAGVARPPGCYLLMCR